MQSGSGDRESCLDAAKASRARILALVSQSETGQETAGAATRRRVLDSAVGLFAEHGYEGCSMKMLAGAAGIKAPALYNHFASKEQILAEALEMALGGFFCDVLNPLEEIVVESWLEAAIGRYAIHKLQHLEIAQASDLLLQTTKLTPHLASQDLERTNTIQTEYMHFVRDLARGICRYDLPESEGTVVAFAIIAMCDRVSEWYNPVERLTPEDIAGYTWRLVQRMLGLA